LTIPTRLHYRPIRRMGNIVDADLAIKKSTRNLDTALCFLKNYYNLTKSVWEQGGVTNPSAGQGHHYE